MNPPPKLSAEQRRSALAKAASNRRIRAEFKEQIKSGRRSWREALESSEEAIQRMRVKELLEALPGFGDTRAMAILERVGISVTRRIQGLGAGQRAKLLEELSGR